MNNRNLYPANWFDTVRPAVLKRDNYKCTQCGIKQRSRGYYAPGGVFVVGDEFIIQWAIRFNYKVQTIFLQIAHLDQNPNNCEASNLSSMCPRCHLNFDRPFNTAKRNQRGRQQSKSI